MYLDDRQSIFLSHNSDDGDLIAEVATYLEDKGIPCWYAPRNIPYGDNYNTRIAIDIEHVEAVLVFITENVEKSEYVPKEISMAIDYKKTIIPIIVDGSPCPKSLELFLCNIQWIDTRAFSSGEEFLDSLAGVMEDVYQRKSTVTTIKKIDKQPIVINNASTNLLFELTAPVLLKAEKVFVPPVGIDVLKNKLKEERILYIYHPQHAGKYTLALSLFREMGIHDLFEWSKEADFKRIIQHPLKRGAGFIADINMAQEFFKGIHEHEIEKYIEKLDQRDAYLILIGRIEPISYLQPYSERILPPQDVKILLINHIPLVESDIELQNRICRWIETKENTKGLPDVMRPRDAYSYVQKVKKLLIGEISEKELVESMDMYVRDRVKNWFIQSEGEARTLKDIAFYLTITVFEHHPYPVVVERFRDLLSLFTEHLGKDIVFEEEFLGRDEYLSRFNAHVKKTWKHTDTGAEAVETVCFYFREDVPIIWEYIWTQHPDFNGPLVKWIQRLLSEGKSILNENIARILIHMMKEDSQGVRYNFIQPWANSEKPAERLFAARILEELAKDEDRTHYVFSLAKSWAGQANNDRLQWTAVVLLGSSLSVSYFPQALRLLYKIHSSNQGKLDFSIQRSLAGLSEIATYGSEYEKLYFRFWASCIFEDNNVSHQALSFAHSIFAKAPQVFFKTHKGENKEFWVTLIKTSLTNSITKRTCMGMLEAWISYSSGNSGHVAHLADLLFSVYRAEKQSVRNFLVRFIDKGVKRNGLLYGPILEKLENR